MGSNPNCGSDFFPSFHLMQKTYHVLLLQKTHLVVSLPDDGFYLQHPQGVLLFLTNMLTVLVVCIDVNVGYLSGVTPSMESTKKLDSMREIPGNITQVPATAPAAAPSVSAPTLSKLLAAETPAAAAASLNAITSHGGAITKVHSPLS